MRHLPLRFRLVFVLSTIAAILALPTMVMVIADFIYQASWRADNVAEVEEGRANHLKVMAAIKRECG